MRPARITIVTLSSGLVALSLMSLQAAAEEYPVGPDDSIQDVVDQAPAGSVITLEPGTYEQDVVIAQEGITVTGPPSAVLIGAGDSRIVQVQADDVTLSGFTIDGLHGDPGSAAGYRDKLIYAMSTTAGDGVDNLHINDMTLRNAGGECVRLRYLLTNADVSGNTIGPCGVHDFQFGAGGKNGEAVYIGTAPEQQGMHGAPDDRADVSHDNHIHHNVINTQGNECVDIKENSTANLVEHNDCTGQLDPNSAGFDARGSGNTFRYNASYDNVGAGIRFGGDTATDGTNNHAYGNTITDNAAGGIKFQATPQGRVCGNIMSGNVGGDAVGTYGDEFDPTQPCDSSDVLVSVLDVTASGDDGNVPQNVLDDDLGTRWSDEGDGVWIELALDGAHDLSRVDIAWHNGDQRTAEFEIQVSADGSTWSTVHTGTSSGSTLQPEPHAVSASDTSFVRVVGYGNTDNDWTSITEIDVYADGGGGGGDPSPSCDPAAHRVTSVRASGDDGNVPGNVLDCDLGTRWSDQGDGVWIELALDGAQTVGSVAIAWHNGDQRAAAFDVQTSADGSSWATVFSGTGSGSTLQPETYAFSQVNASFVRIVGHGNTENDWTSITEIMAYEAGGDGGGDPGGCDYPGDILDLSNWKITLPIDDPDESGTQPLEIFQPDLDTYEIDPWFIPTDDCTAVQFRNAVDGATTPNSSYSRSELREMTNGGDDQASWSSTSGTHTLTITQAITHLPNDKPHVVAGQIHDSDDDVTVFRLQGSSLYVTNGDDSTYHLVTDDYELGTVFEAKFVVSDGEVEAYYNGQHEVTLDKDFTGGYFKAGAYTQANCGNSSPCGSGNYGEVIVYDVTVTHT